MQISIRNYTPEDRSPCLEIFKSNQPKYFADYEYEEFSKWLEGEQSKYFSVLESEGEILGCGGIYLDEEQKEIGLAWGMIHSNCHGMGLGTLLTNYRIGQMENIGKGYLQVVRTSQLTARFYEKMGFKIKSTEKDGWAKGLDKVSMTRP